MRNIPRAFLKAVILASCMLVFATSHAIQFTDIAEGDNAGITYRSQKTDRNAEFDALKQQLVVLPEEIVFAPNKPRGNPGVAIFDFDMDGDLDILVTNSSNTGVNSLYANQFVESGETVFIDKAAAAGLDLPGLESVAICFGDTDNDGDKDVYITGLPSSVMMENNGDGTFTDISKSSHTETSGYHPATCGFGDVNGDGLLDLVVGNSFDWNDLLALRLPEFSDLMQANLLFINNGGNTFVDKSAGSGIQNVARITWAIGLVDYDLDGDLDIVAGDDQGPKLPAAFGGQDYGYLRFYENDGAGQFQDVTEALNTNRYGGWMGMSFADYNRDGILDFFASNAGDYAGKTMPVPSTSEWQSTWFLGQQDGTYQFPGLGTLGTSRFGWSAASIDYDNDGDTDIYYAGGLDVVPRVVSNPGTLLENDGAANFSWDAGALPDSEYHKRRNVQGSALGDLNNDGFIDIVNVSNMNWPLTASLILHPPLGGALDSVATFWPTFRPADPNDFSKGIIWNGVVPHDGTLSVQINNADNDNNWVKVKTMGSIALLEHGKVNRDGIGAVIGFQPEDGKKVMLPVVSGMSHNSSNALEAVFGLGAMDKGDVDVLWPGGVRNKLYNVHAGKRIVFPEIPCSYDSPVDFGDYRECVAKATDMLVEKEVLAKPLAKRFYSSAVRAYQEYHDEHEDDDDEEYEEE